MGRDGQETTCGCFSVKKHVERAKKKKKKAKHTAKTPGQESRARLDWSV